MKKILSITMLVLVSSLIFTGMTNSVQAQTDPFILLKIAKQAQDQLKNQIKSDSPEKIQQLFEEGRQQVNNLEESLNNNEIDTAKKYFLASMGFFKKVSKELTVDSQTETSNAKNSVQNPTSDLFRIQEYVNNLKTISKKYNTTIDFSEIDGLFENARKEISNGQYEDAQNLIYEIKQMTVTLNTKIRELSTQQEQTRAQKYAMSYIEQLDRLIENAKVQELPEDVILELENAKENLSTATNTQEIIKQIREIISIKNQFELTKNDRLESRVMQVERSIVGLSNSDKISTEELDDARKTLEIIKHHLSQGEHDEANELLRSLVNLTE